MKTLTPCFAAMALPLLLAHPPASAAAAAAPFGRLVVFGDSYSDEGNVPLNLPGYYMNRRSNGPVWVEDLAELLRIPSPTASLRGGPSATNFAYAGAPAAGSNPNDTSLPNLAAQVGQFLSRGAPTPSDLFIIEIGGIDFLRAGQTNPTVPANAIVNQVKRLSAAGARSFLVANLVPIGEWPDYRGTPDQPRFDALVDRFNQTLAADLAALPPALDPSVDLRPFDLHQVFADAIAQPARFGFTNATQGANDVAARDPDHYVFWDFGHPTRAMHQLLADRAYATLTAPEATAQTLLLLLSALAALRRARRPTAPTSRAGSA